MAISWQIFYFKGDAEPTYQHLDFVVKELRKKKNINFDCFISIGGGSTIDFSKGMATLIKNPGSSLKYRGFPKKSCKKSTCFGKQHTKCNRIR